MKVCWPSCRQQILLCPHNLGRHEVHIDTRYRCRRSLQPNLSLSSATDSFEAYKKTAGNSKFEMQGNLQGLQTCASFVICPQQCRGMCSSAQLWQPPVRMRCAASSHIWLDFAASCNMTGPVAPCILQVTADCASLIAGLLHKVSCLTLCDQGCKLD